MLRRFSVSVLLLLVWVVPIGAQDGIRILSDIAYVAEGAERQVLDIYLPAEAEDGLHPVLFMVHGGAFFAGDKSEIAPIALRYVEMGYAVIAPNYRLAPDVQFPSSHGDVFCAMAWTYAYAEQYQLDLNQVTLFGESAGGNIVGYLGTVDDASAFMTDCALRYPDNPTFEGVIAVYAPIDLLSCECTLARRLASFYTGISFFDWQDEDDIAEHFDMSLTFWLDASDPPFYLLHGDTDFLVPVSEAEFFVDVYEAVGGDVELVVFEGANHGFLTGYSSPFDDLSYEVLDEILVIGG